MMKKYLILLASVFLSVIAAGNVSAATKQEAVYVAKFNYTPFAQVAPGSTGVTFIMGPINYVPDNKEMWFAYRQFHHLDTVLKQDIAKALIAKGFSVRGPFNSYDRIPYPDKQAGDLYVIMKMALTDTWKDRKIARVAGNIDIEIREIATHELMWAKSIPLEEFEFPYDERLVAKEHRGMRGFYDVTMNSVAKGIEKQYPNLINRLAKLFNPEEMKTIDKMAQELKSKKTN